MTFERVSFDVVLACDVRKWMQIFSPIINHSYCWTQHQRGKNDFLQQVKEIQ